MGRCSMTDSVAKARDYYQAGKQELFSQAFDAGAERVSGLKKAYRELEGANAALDATVIALMVEAGIRARDNARPAMYHIAQSLLTGEELEKPR